MATGIRTLMCDLANATVEGLSQTEELANECIETKIQNCRNLAELVMDVTDSTGAINAGEPADGRAGIRESLRLYGSHAWQMTNWPFALIGAIRPNQ